MKRYVIAFGAMILLLGGLFSLISVPEVSR